MSLIECKNINRFFGNGENRVHVLKDVSLSIEKGDFVAIIGQSGSGKSTLMNILGCLDTATSGSYQIDGIETSQMQPDELAALRRERFRLYFPALQPVKLADRPRQRRPACRIYGHGQ